MTRKIKSKNHGRTRDGIGDDVLNEDRAGCKRWEAIPLAHEEGRQYETRMCGREAP